LLWNVFGRIEYHYKPLRTLFCGNRYMACGVLGVWIFSFSKYRYDLFDAMLKGGQQPEFLFFASSEMHDYVGYAVTGVGQLFVLSATYQLGLVGTYLGDYCGIYMEKRVTGFPFNVLDNPMYIGSSLSYLGHAIRYKSMAGVLVSFVVFVVYKLALLFEEPFTARIYRSEAARQAAEILNSATPASKAAPTATTAAKNLHSKAD
jgi:phosphatidylethanolamine N-methyltransferase